MTLNKKRYFRKKSNAVYNLILFDFKVIKHVINIFLFPQKKIKTILKNRLQQCNHYTLFRLKVLSQFLIVKKFREKLHI
jgi:hypothetical protein